MLMSGEDYRESLRRLSPRVFVNGTQIDSVADEPRLAPGVRAIARTYDMALEERHARLLRASEQTSGRTVNRMLHVDRNPQDLIEKAEAVRLLCREVGCAQRYLSGDALCAIHQAAWQIDAEAGTEYHARLLAYLRRSQDQDLTHGIAMTDGKGDRSLRPHQQVNRDAYVHIKARRPDGIVIRGAKAIVPARPTCTSCWSCPAAR